MTIKRMPAPQGFVAEPFADTNQAAQTQPPGSPARSSPAAAQPGTRAERQHALNAADGTRQLLISGAWIMLVGVLAGLLTAFAFGGVGPQGAHTNAGWLSLMVAMMSTPFAILLLLLGGAKWLRNYRLSQAQPAL